MISPEDVPPGYVRPLAAGLALALCWSLEAFLDRREKARVWRHDLLNLALMGVNALVLTVPLAWLVTTLDTWFAERSIGLLRGVFADRRLLPLEAAVALLALDLFTWWWHWMNHRLAPLWRFHRLHHTDPAMNSTTAFRFHLGEHVISAAARGVMLGAIGLRLEWVILWELLFLPLVVFQHSRIPLPTPWERTLRLVIITPGVHRVHHSPDRIETDSHFGSILSIWDRLFGTWRPRDDAFDRPTGLPDRGAG